MSKLEELIQIIRKDSNYLYYQKLEVKINENEDIKNKVANIKQLQTQIVLAKELGKRNKVSNLEEKYDSLLLELEEVPHVLEYLELQKYYNDLIQDIKSILENEVENMLK